MEFVKYRAGTCKTERQSIRHAKIVNDYRRPTLKRIYAKPQKRDQLKKPKATDAIPSRRQPAGV